MVLECDHDFGVEVTSATPSVVVVGIPSEETVTILDDESMYVRKLILFTDLTKGLPWLFNTFHNYTYAINLWRRAVVYDSNQ